jgi:hypothetical protein
MSMAHGAMQSVTPLGANFATAWRIQAEIGARLRSVYGVVLAEPVPDDWLALIRKLESGDGGLASPTSLAALQSQHPPPSR